MPDTKECVAYAESIKTAARLCKHCVTMQDEVNSVKTTSISRKYAITAPIVHRYFLELDMGFQPVG